MVAKDPTALRYENRERILVDKRVALNFIEMQVDNDDFIGATQGKGRRTENGSMISSRREMVDNGE
jgi:hypothetical protein